MRRYIIFFIFLSFCLVGKSIAQSDPGLDTVSLVTPDNQHQFGSGEDYIFDLKQDYQYDLNIHGNFNIYIQIAEIHDDQTAEEAMNTAISDNDFFKQDTLYNKNSKYLHIYFKYPFKPLTWYAYRLIVKYDNVDNVLSTKVCSFQSKMLIYGFYIDQQYLKVLYTESTSLDDISGTGYFSTSKRSDTVVLDHVALNLINMKERLGGGYIYSNTIDDSYFLQDNNLKATFHTDSLAWSDKWNFYGNIELTTNIQLANGDSIRFEEEGIPMEYSFGIILLRNQDIAQKNQYNLLDDRMYLNFKEYFYSIQAYNNIISPLVNDLEVTYNAEDISLSAEAKFQNSTSKIWQSTNLSGQINLLDSAISIVPSLVIVDYDDVTSDSATILDGNWRGLNVKNYDLKGNQSDFGGIILPDFDGLEDIAGKIYVGSEDHLEINLTQMSGTANVKSNLRLMAKLDSLNIESDGSLENVSGTVEGSLYLPLIDSTDYFSIAILNNIIQPAKFKNLPFSFDSLAGFDKAISISAESVKGSENIFTWDSLPYLDHYNVTLLLKKNSSDFELVETYNVSENRINFIDLESNGNYKLIVEPVLKGDIMAVSSEKTFLTPYYQEKVTSLEGQLEHTYKIYPNPVEFFLKIQPSSADQIKVNDLQGKLVFEKKLLPKEQQTVLDLSNLENGIYFISFLRNDQVVGREKLIKN